MIIGVGTDIVQIERISGVLNHLGNRFAQRILTPTEFGVFKEHHYQASFLAKRFAAKEALSKALQTGIGAVSWQNIHISRSATGAPELALTGHARKVFGELGGKQMFLSITDEKDYALAFVVLSC